MTTTRFHWALGAVASVMLLGQSTAKADTPSETFTAVASSVSPLSYSEEYRDYYAGMNDNSIVVKTASLSLLDGLVASCDCDGSGCDAGNCCKRRKRRFIAGVEAVFLNPNIDGRSVSYAVTNTGSNTTNTNSGVGAEDLYGSPRVWLGLQGECWGLMVRYWELNGSEGAFTPFIPAGAPGHAALERLELRTIDLEISRKFTRKCTDMIFSVGVRHAEFDNQTSASGFEDVGANRHTGTAYTERQLSGTGVTAALSGLRPIGCSNWELFWSARGSAIFGQTQRISQTSSAVFVGGGGAISVDTAVAAGSTETMFIGEIQAGVQREFPLKCIDATAFFRAGLEYQYWDAEQNGLTATVSGAAASGSTGVANASAGDLRMDLIGFNLGTGFYW